ncbi:MAG: carbohydrate ABC transporter permease [Anaerolineae bacterium]
MYKMHKWPVIGVFVAPALILYLVFVVYPYFEGFRKSLTAWSGLTGTAKFVGLGNFRALLQDPVFLTGLRNTVLLWVYTMPPVLVLALFLAVVLNRPGGWAYALRVAFFMPALLSTPAAAALGTQIYNAKWGLFNSTLKALGLNVFTRMWLGEPNLALLAVASIWIWIVTGFYMIIFHAGLQNIPVELLDAARVDGANAWQQFRFVTLPLLWEVVKVAVVFFIIGSFAYSFALIHVMTEGDPAHATEVIGTWLYYKAYREASFGYAAAMGVVIFLLSFMFSAIGVWVMRREVVEY